MKRTDIKRFPMADSVLDNLEPESKEYRVHDSEGLYFRVKPNGTKSWQFRYKKPDGKWSFMGLGGYGKGNHQLTGKEARTKARQLLSEAEKTSTPLMALKTIQEEANKATFKKLAIEFFEAKKAEWSEGTYKRNIGAIEKYIFPVVKNRNYAEIASSEWLNILKDISNLGIKEQAKRITTLVRSIYALALVTGRVSRNPLDGLSTHLPAPVKTNFSFVSQKELPKLIQDIRSYSASKDVRIGLELLAYLFVRPSELRLATWSEFDLDNAIWTIPAEHTKKNREHLVPLPRQAIALLKELHAISGAYPLLFIGKNDNSKPKSNTAFVMALRRLGYQNRQTAHGFRHIASTLLNENDFNFLHVEAQLAHILQGTAGAYNKAQYLDQRKKMMQWYADYLDSLAEGGKIAPLHDKEV